MRRKPQRKLKSFFDEKKEPSKKVKAVVSFMEVANPEEEEKFFTTNYKTIFTIIQSVFETILQSKQQKQVKASKLEKDMVQLMAIMEKILVLLPEVINSKWNTGQITEFLEVFLYMRNKKEIRLQGFKLYLLFLEALKEPEDELLLKLAASVNIGALRQGYTGEIGEGPWAKSLSAPNFEKVVIVKTKNNDIEETTELLGFLLDFIATAKPNRFEYWFGVLKDYFLKYCYHDIAVKNGMLSDDHGFLSYCPVPVQAVLVKRIKKWLEEDKLVSILMAKENHDLCLEFYTQAMQTTDFATAEEYFQVYKEFFLPSSGNVHKILADNYKFYQKFFITGLAHPFQTITPGEMKQSTFCMSVLQFFKKYVSSGLDKQIVSILLKTILNIAVDLFNNKENSKFSLEMGRSVMDTVLFAWIRSGTTSDSLWKELQQSVSKLFFRKEPINQVNITLKQLTVELLTLRYPKPKDVKKKKGRGAPSAEDRPMPKRTFGSAPTPGTDEWNVDSVLYVWEKVLGIFQTVNSIKDPKMHSTVMQGIGEIVMMLLECEKKADYNELLACTTRIPIVDVFGRWLFEACELDEAIYNAGKCTAYEILCKIVCSPNCRRLPLPFMKHFLRVLHDVFSQTKWNLSVVSTIFETSTNLFSMGFEGITCLIPPVLKIIGRILGKKKSKKKISVSLKKNATSVLCSLVCYPSHFANLDSTIKKKSKKSKENKSMHVLKVEIAGLLTHVIQNVPMNQLKVTSLCGLVVMLCQELVLPSPDKSLIEEWFSIFLEATSSEHDIDVVQMALDNLCTVGINLRKEILKTVPGIPKYVILDLCKKVMKMMSKTMKAEGTISRFFSTIHKWVLSSGSSLFDDVDSAVTVFKVVEYGILGMNLINEPKRSPEMFFQNYINLLRFPRHGNKTIADAAEGCLFGLLNFYGNYPPRNGKVFMSSSVLESDDGTNVDRDKQLLFCLNDDTIMSVVDVTHKGKKYARIIVRSPGGKYCWDAEIVPSKDSDIPQPIGILEAIEKSGMTTKKDDEIEKLNLEEEVGPDHFMNFLAKSVEKDAATLNKPAPPLKKFITSFNKSEKALLSQDTMESSYVDSLDQEFASAKPGNAIIPSTANHYSRLFLSQLNLLSIGDQANPSVGDAFVVVENSGKLQRIVNQLDKSPGREVLKIGLIYVLESQEFEKEILKNDRTSRSTLFTDFVNGLGWPAKLKHHKGYTGGLDEVNLTTGVTSPYYADHHLEVIFHDITSMITDPQDPVQLLKKRHVGNDIVQIIYSEHSRDYSPTTITSQFNDSHVVCYPLPNGFFRIQIHKKPQIKAFGPLVNGMVVPMRILPLLARETAINANQTVRYAQPAYQSPYPTRRRYLQDIVKKITDRSAKNKIQSLLLHGAEIHQLTKS